MFVLVAGLVGSASGDIAFDAASSGTDGGGDTTLSWSHTIGSGSNRILIVLALAEDTSESDTTITSITYNSTAMTEVSGTNVWESPLRANMYYMLETDLPSSGAYTIEITYQGTVSDLAGGAISLTGVKQQAAEAVATGSDGDNTVISTNITTQTDGAWVIDLVGGDRVESFFTTTSGMVERFDDAGSNTHTAAGSTKPVASAGSTTMSWEFDGSSSVLVHTLASFEKEDATAPEKATNPSPSHQATGIGINDDLSWTAGSGATSHDVYFGTDSTPDATEFQGNQTETTYEPGTMEYDTTYYWRIDEKNEVGTTTGDVWYFTTAAGSPPGQASNPDPCDTATGIDIDANLSWTAGSGATSHDVYFGTDSTPDSGEFQGNQTETTYEPGTTVYNTTYYWRIDEKNEYGTATGDVWSFTTELVPNNVHWTVDDPGDHLWSTVGNWEDSTKPTINDKAAIDEGITGPIVESGMSEETGALTIGRADPGAAAELTITGGTLDIGGGVHPDDGQILVANVTSSSATVTMSGGTLTTSNQGHFGRRGVATLNLTGSGAQLDIGTWLKIGSDVVDPGTGHVNLDAGTITCTDFMLYETSGTMDIEAGELIIDGDETADINDAVSDGRLTGYGGGGTVNWDYDVTNAGKTTVWATASGGTFMYWSGDFNDITVTEHITTQNSVVSGSSTTTLYTSDDAEISADNSATAQLSLGSCTLVTEYRLTFDGDGSSATGSSTVDWTSYDSFLSPAAGITHISDDNDVEVTLYVRASNQANQLADAGTYTATQTLTAHWVGP